MAILLAIEEKEKIKILKREGLSYEKIGKRINRSTMTVYRICNPQWVEDQMKTERIRSLAYYHNHRHDYCNIDHVTPLSKGGLHEIGNVVLACKACNMAKRARINSEFKVAI